MCATGQMNEYSNKLKTWTNKMFDSWHGRCGCDFSILSTLHYTTAQCKNDQRLLIFSFIGSLSHSDKLHHHSGTWRISLLSFTRHVPQRQLLPLWLIGSSKPGDLWPCLQGYDSPKGLLQVLWESFTRWMFKVAELCFVKCVFMLRHVVSFQSYKRVKILD